MSERVRKGNHVEVWKSPENDEWYFRFVAANHEIMTNSEGYHNKQDAIDSAMIAHAGYKIYLGENGVWVDYDDIIDDDGSEED